MIDGPFSPIASAPRDCQILVKAGSNYAKAYWTGDMWALGGCGDLVEQLDFEPREWCELGR